MKDLLITRRQILKGAGAAGVLGALGAPVAALAEEDQDGNRIYIFVAFSQAPPALGLAKPRIGLSGAGTFNPSAQRVNGGGNYVLFDAMVSNPKPLVASGGWKAERFVSYDTKGLGSYGTIQPGILVMTADVDGIGEDLTLRLICNVGAVPLLTGEDEGWVLSGTAYGTFHPLSPSLIGITHLSVEGFRIGGD